MAAHASKVHVCETYGPKYNCVTLFEAPLTRGCHPRFMDHDLLVLDLCMCSHRAIAPCVHTHTHSHAAPPSTRVERRRGGEGATQGVHHTCRTLEMIACARPPRVPHAPHQRCPIHRRGGEGATSSKSPSSPRTPGYPRVA